MASRQISDLSAKMQAEANFIVYKCKENNVDLLIYCTLRSLEEQTILFRSSDLTGANVKAKIKKFRKRGLGFLADIIEAVGPQKYTGWKTSAAPGESFHNYRLAFDAVPILAGKAMWNYKDYPEGWDTYGQACKMAGLEWGGNWPAKHKDMPHAQLGEGGNPLKMYPPDQIQDMLTKNGLL